MKHIKIILFLVFLSTYAFSQNEGRTDENKNNCLFGYISEIPGEFTEVISYLDALDVEVLGFCDGEFLIYIKLNPKFKEYRDLFAKIEKRFNGICYYKSSENKIPLYPKCREIYLKETVKN